MKRIINLLTRESVIGEIGADGIDRLLHAEILALADELGVKSHYLEFSSAELCQRGAHHLIPAAARWLIGNNIDIILSPANIAPDRENRTVGTIAIRAAMQAATVTNRTFDVFEVLDLFGLRGDWTANGIHHSSVYTRHHIGAVMISPESFESYIAAQF